MVGLLEAIKRFDPKRGCKLSTYAVFWIRNQVFREIDFNLPPFEPEPEVEQTIEDNLYEYLDILKVLKERERFIIYNHFFLDKSLQEIADELGLTRERVRQIKREALTKLRSQL